MVNISGPHTPWTYQRSRSQAHKLRFHARLRASSKRSLPFICPFPMLQRDNERKRPQVARKLSDLAAPYLLTCYKPWLENQAPYSLLWCLGARPWLLNLTCHMRERERERERISGFGKVKSSGGVHFLDAYLSWPVAGLRMLDWSC